MLRSDEDTGGTEQRQSKKRGRTVDKKKKKTDKKGRRKSRSPGRTRHRRHRTSAHADDPVADLPVEAATVPTRLVSLASPGSEQVNPRPIAVQPADPALEPTSPADGERDRSSVSELEYMLCCRGSARLLATLQKYPLGGLIAWVPLTDVLVSSLDRPFLSTAFRTAAVGNSGGWPPMTVAHHSSGLTAEYAFLPCRSLEIDFCHLPTRPDLTLPVQPASCNNRQWSASTITAICPEQPYPASACCISASRRSKYHHAPALEPLVLGPGLVMESKDSTDDAEISSCPQRHPGTPVGTLVEIFRRQVPQLTPYEGNVLPLTSVEEPATSGAEDPHSMPCTSPTVAPPLCSTPHTVSTHRRRTGQVPRPSQAPHIRVFSSSSRGKACKVTPPATRSSSSSSIQLTGADQSADAHHLDPLLGWLPEDDTLLDVGGPVEQPSGMIGQTPPLLEGRLGKACAKMLIRTGLRCIHCFRLKDHCCCTEKSSITLRPRLHPCTARMQLFTEAELFQAAALPLQWPTTGSKRTAPTAYLAPIVGSNPHLGILSDTPQPEVLHPPPRHPQPAASYPMQVTIHTSCFEQTWGSRFHRRRRVLVLNASRRIMWSHASISLTQIIAQVDRSLRLVVHHHLQSNSIRLSSEVPAPLNKPIGRSPPAYPESRPGPKSRSGVLARALLFQRLQPCTGVSTDVRVAGKVTRPAGARTAICRTSSHLVAKHRETDASHQQVEPIPQTIYAKLTRTGKRSFHRAVKRAKLHGTTTYRGRQHTLQTLGCPEVTHNLTSADTVHHNHPQHSPSPPETCSPTYTPSVNTTPPGRWRVVCWNAGGLTVAKLQEIELWLEQCHTQGSTVHVCVLTETHWSFDSEWQLSSYNVIHSGLSNRKGGVLLLVHKGLVTAQDIRTTAYIRGRLMLARLETSPAIYIIATYQHVWSEQAGPDECVTAREAFWTQLTAAIRSVPWRAQLLVAGDMTTPCITQPPHVGRGVTPVTGTIRQTDQSRLQDIISQFNLVALNTWGRIKHSHTYKFEHPNHTHITQIDFLFFRAPHTDNLAKSARTVQAPFVPAKGMRHLPLHTSLPMPSEPRSRCPRRAPCKAATVARQLWQDPELADRFRHRVAELQPANYSGDPAAVLNRVMQQAWHEISPPGRGIAVVQEHATVGLVRQLWALRRQHKQTPRTYSALRGWLHVVKLAKVQRALKKACRAKKRERIETLLREAEQSRFPSAIFSVVKKLAPKSRTQRIQLGDEEGKLLAGREEAEHIARFLRTVYHSSDIQTAPPVPTIIGMHFTPDDLLCALSSLAPAKALPLEFMPARLWKLIPEQVLDMLLPCMNLEGSGLQDEWHKVQLHLIPKISHVKDPKHLRPIALLHPGNKLLASMIARQVQHKVARYLDCVPQWAYLPSRSTHDALLSVCAHLNQVRGLIQAHSSTLPQRFLGAKRPRMLGGVSISLDVKKAFDSLSHSFLRESMLDADFTPQEIDLILHLHSQACLRIGQPGQTSDVYLGTGVRQGCSLSPLLWALSTGRFYRLYQDALKQQNLPEGLTNIFADDVFSSWLFKTPGEFKAALRSIGVLVQTLQRVGLALSQDKTVILLATTGTSAASILQKVKRNIEQAPHLEIRVGTERMFFKIASSHVYLGAVITYRNFELTNLKSRMQKAWGCFWRLHHLLIHRALSLKTRVRLWQTCVFSVLRYSLHSMGLPPQGPTMIRQAVSRQLRLIARSPAHLWHTTTDEIYRRVQVEDPWHTLCRQFTALATRPDLVYQVQGIQNWLTILDATFTIAHASPAPTAQPAPTPPVQSGPSSSISAPLIPRGAHAPRSLACAVCHRVFDSL